MAPIVEHVSGNTLEFEMGSLVPGTHYKVGVYAVKEALKSNPTVTEFTTGRLRPHAALTALPCAEPTATMLLSQTWTLLGI